MKTLKSNPVVYSYMFFRCRFDKSNWGMNNNIELISKDMLKIFNRSISFTKVNVILSTLNFKIWKENQ